MDELTPAEAADAARRIIGQIEALARWAIDNDASLTARFKLGESLGALMAARREIEQMERAAYRGQVEYDRRPVKPLGGGR